MDCISLIFEFPHSSSLSAQALYFWYIGLCFMTVLVPGWLRSVYQLGRSRSLLPETSVVWYCTVCAYIKFQKCISSRDYYIYKVQYPTRSLLSAESGTCIYTLHSTIEPPPIVGLTSLTAHSSHPAYDSLVNQLSIAQSHWSFSLCGEQMADDSKFKEMHRHRRAFPNCAHLFWKDITCRLLTLLT